MNQVSQRCARPPNHQLHPMKPAQCHSIISLFIIAARSSCKIILHEISRKHYVSNDLTYLIFIHFNLFIAVFSFMFHCEFASLNAYTSDFQLQAGFVHCGRRESGFLVKTSSQAFSRIYIGAVHFIGAIVLQPSPTTAPGGESTQEPNRRSQSHHGHLQLSSEPSGEKSQCLCSLRVTLLDDAQATAFLLEFKNAVAAPPTPRTQRTMHVQAHQIGNFAILADNIGQIRATGGVANLARSFVLEPAGTQPAAAATGPAPVIRSLPTTALCAWSQWRRACCEWCVRRADRWRIHRPYSRPFKKRTALRYTRAHN
jgi:hypothetical protein